ncbi:MAG: hypothetical protein LBD64_02740 [Odoribacteraceae bacterium]|jgi:hypothetical protein|nr:hypothetical protein [Odoribacteraceae bacterium]
MKHAILYITIIAALTGACSKEEQPVASANTGLLDIFTPGSDADPVVRDIYNSHGIWIRTEFASVQELTNGYLEVDALVRVRGAKPLDPALKDEVYAYTNTLLSNVPGAFTKAFFPLEIFYVESYGASWWVYPLKHLGRSRLIISWPNTTIGTIPVADPAKHYYQDSVLTVGVWNIICQSITARMEEPIADFVAAGKTHDGGKAYDQILNAYYADYDIEKYDAAIDELTREGGFLTGAGSRDFRSDLASWIQLLATESSENIQREYLDNSPARAAKYAIVIDFARQHGWDIQAAGNTFRQRRDNP